VTARQSFAAKPDRNFFFYQSNVCIVDRIRLSTKKFRRDDLRDRVAKRLERRAPLILTRFRLHLIDQFGERLSSLKLDAVSLPSFQL
jgi:hypothetical protein